MEDCCTPQCRGIKMIVLGIILVLVRWFTSWDIWIVLGVLAIIFGIKKLIMPVCLCNANNKKKR